MSTPETPDPGGPPLIPPPPPPPAVAWAVWVAVDVLRERRTR